MARRGGGGGGGRRGGGGVGRGVERVGSHRPATPPKIARRAKAGRPRMATLGAIKNAQAAPAKETPY